MGHGDVGRGAEGLVETVEHVEHPVEARTRQELAHRGAGTENGQLPSLALDPTSGLHDHGEDAAVQGPQLAQEKLAQNGIALIVARHLPKTYLDGAALWTREGVPVVGMTLRYDRLDNFWFCLLHELAHLGRHFEDGEGQMFIDDLQLRERDHEGDDAREQEADEWAQDALIPHRLWLDHAARVHPSVANVVTLSQQAEVHPAIVAGRIRYERRSYRLLSQFVGSNLVRPHFPEDAV